jgi:hypothetical protein
MHRLRSAPLAEDFTHSARQQTQRVGLGQTPAGPVGLASSAAPFVRRELSRESSRALEILGHAIEYLADEYAVDTADKGPLGSADPRVEAIQVLKALNRAIYYSGAEVQPVLGRWRRWLSGLRAIGGSPLL